MDNQDKVRTVIYKEFLKGHYIFKRFIGKNFDKELRSEEDDDGSIIQVRKFFNDFESPIVPIGCW